MTDAKGGVTPERIKETLGRMGVPEKPAAKPPSPQPRHDDSRGSVVARARAYLAKIDPAIAGQGGSNLCFRAAAVLVLGFDLSIGEATPLMHEYSERCSPPWSDKEIQHKLESANAKPGPRGNLLNQERTPQPIHAQPAAHQPPPMEDLEPPPPPDESVKPFPVDVFPPRVTDFIRQVAASKDCPVDFPAFGVLGVAAGAIGTSRKIMLKPDWGEFPKFYLGIVGVPAMSKTPALKDCMRPVFRRQKRMAADHKSSLKSWTAAGKNGDAPEFEHCLSTDFTVEKLGRILDATPRGIVAFKDELADWIQSMNQYKATGKGSDGNFWLTAWSSGEGMAKIDRMNSPFPQCVSEPLVVVLGGIQPARVASIFGEMAKQGDGFVDRVLWAYPQQRVSRATRISVHPDVSAAWGGIVDKLYDLPFAVRNDLSGDQEAFGVTLEAEAEDLWYKWLGEHDDEACGLDFPTELASSWAKMRSHCGRIILVLHLLRFVEGECGEDHVDAESVVRGVAVAEYLKAHLYRIAGRMASTPLDLKVDKFVEWVRKHGGKVTAREAAKIHLCGIRSATEARGLFEMVADRGHGVVCSGPAKGGKVSTMFRMHDTIEFNAADAATTPQV